MDGFLAHCCLETCSSSALRCNMACGFLLWNHVNWKSKKFFPHWINVINITQYSWERWIITGCEHCVNGQKWDRWITRWAVCVFRMNICFLFLPNGILLLEELFLRFLRGKRVNNMKEAGRRTHVVGCGQKNSTTAVSHTSGQRMNRKRKKKVHFR